MNFIHQNDTHWAGTVDNVKFQCYAVVTCFRKEVSCAKRICDHLDAVYAEIAPS